MKIEVDRSSCQGHAMCCFTAPEVYTLDEHGYNSMGTFEVKPAMEEAARVGASSCPEFAIRIIEQ